MEFRIADTFTDSLARLSGEEQEAVKTTAFDHRREAGRHNDLRSCCGFRRVPGWHDDRDCPRPLRTDTLL
jgi:hypothetical protein